MCFVSIYPKQVKAGALLYALLVLMLMSVLLSSMLLYQHLWHGLNQRMDLQVEAEAQAVSATYYFLALDPDKKGPVHGTLWESASDSFRIETAEWGIFRRLHVRAYKGRFFAEKSCLLGSRPAANLKAALYLSDNHKPLKVVGNTQLIGDAYLPESGIEPGYIGNQSFTGRSLIQGKIKKSKDESLYVEYAEINRRFMEFWQLLDANQARPSDPHFPTQTYFSQNPTLLGGVFPPYSEILCAAHIEIPPQVRLSQVVVYAPVVRIKEGFRGNLQVFATDSIIVEKDVRLSYPSALVLAPRPYTSSRLRIAEGATVEGAVLHAASILGGRQKRPHTELDKGARVHGNLITDGNLTLNGSVWGFVACYEFMLPTPTALYSNHLLDAEIDAEKLHPDFLTGMYVKGSYDIGVIYWNP